MIWNSWMIKHSPPPNFQDNRPEKRHENAIHVIIKKLLVIKTLHGYLSTYSDCTRILILLHDKWWRNEFTTLQKFILIFTSENIGLDLFFVFFTFNALWECIIETIHLSIYFNQSNCALELNDICLQSVSKCFYWLDPGICNCTYRLCIIVLVDIGRCR